MLPALPGDTDPDDPHVEVYAMQCRTCGAYGPLVSMENKSDPGHRWDADHFDEFKALGQRHATFYSWQLVRNTARIF